MRTPEIPPYEDPEHDEPTVVVPGVVFRNKILNGIALRVDNGDWDELVEYVMEHKDRLKELVEARKNIA